MSTQPLLNFDQRKTQGMSDFDYLDTPFGLPTTAQPYVSDLQSLEYATVRDMPRYAEHDSSSIGTSGQPSPDHSRWIFQVRLVTSVSVLMTLSMNSISRVPSAHVHRPPTTG